MRRTTRFYLAVFALLGSSHAAQHKPDQCAFEPGAIVSDACATYSDLEEINEEVQPYLDKITKETDFFSYWRLNLYNKKCPFWSDENGMCGNIACAVNTLENEEDIPLVWRAEELGKLEGPKAQHPGRKVRDEQKKGEQRPLRGSLGEDVGESCVVEYDDECDERDYCVPDDEGASAKGDYVSLLDNPERFTGYAGVGSQQVWEAIYRENCFSKPQANSDSVTPAGSGLGLGGLSGGPGQAAQDLRNVMRNQPLQQNVQSAIANKGARPSARVDQLEFDDECLEKRVFYRVVSGMHASISTHLCWDFLNQTTGKWHPNLACYENRLHKFPDRISNLYFNYALVLRAVGKLRNHLQDYQFCSADPAQDASTKSLVLSLIDTIPANQREQIFDESVMFQDSHAAVLKEDFKHRFRNVSRVMDCVGCDKCRLWGKLQVTGYGTALKVLFEFDEKDASSAPPLRRTELVALVNTLGRISHSIHAIKQFRRMIDERDGVKSNQPASHLPADPTGPPVLPTPIADAYEARKSLEAEQERLKKEAEKKAEDDGYPPFVRKPRLKDPTPWESVKEEAELVWNAYWWVLRQWAAIPGKFIRIAIVELSRLWDFWLGLPVKPRSWEFKPPKVREEL
ncbi:Endoplasmic oxidoreductin-1 protein [Lasiodiplodia theobromae]|uniref:Endoplasmic reticulum oxidoreductin-1 n=1 Tax=Lasiodiplodia theobromae TaxID=45133 RepID=A0A5N5D9J1_9PEZI|nr:Endoplasmic oxidoreductin-1 protein [Lasiodiplodia theobromae]KAB2573972.1 Endoplasmic reticulum oxidoreductin-1 [Lasiodiplodia theobromae]KAF4538259.1 Endoplasmic oxidoreductin-1 protein [Lasiodiplodia theobromae]